jgi:hypothetical protein
MVGVAVGDMVGSVGDMVGASVATASSSSCAPIILCIKELRYLCSFSTGTAFALAAIHAASIGAAVEEPGSEGIDHSAG